MADETKAVPQDDLDEEGLREMLNALLAAEFEEKQRLIESEQNALLNPSAEAMLRTSAEDAIAREEKDTAAFFGAHAALLVACREHGTARVFADMREQAKNDYAIEMPEALLQELQALVGEARERPSRDNFEQQIELCELLLHAAPRDWDPELWAMLQDAKGNALGALGAWTSDADTLARADEAYQEALKERTRERTPMEWAGTQNNLGIALQDLGDLTGDAATLARAGEAYSEALLEYTRDRAPMLWAKVQNNLGIVRLKLGPVIN
jgi:tetratricopeptide (TPR) repeat protein